jgi:soluble lytic murein transglycosylase-like protein
MRKLLCSLALAGTLASASASNPVHADGNCVIATVMCSGGSSTYQQNVPTFPGGDYRTIAYNAAIAAGISADLFVKQINQESGFNPNAVSSVGAIGISQIMPTTAQGWNVDPHDPVASLQAAAQHMAGYYKSHGNDYAKALSCYNYGPTGTANAIAKWGYDWKQHIPLETINYINVIMG